MAGYGGILLYPNPGTGLLTIDVDGNDSYSLKITNALGQVILYDAVVPAGKHTINLTHVVPGVYFAYLQNSTLDVTRKFIISR